MSTIEEYKRKKIHTRHIDITTYEVDEQRIIVEGILKDDSLQTTYQFTGEKISPKTIHHMIIRMMVKGPLLTIEDLEVEMPSAPTEKCFETLEMLSPIKGMKISPGFTTKVKALVGGPKGCAHVVSLLLTMLPAAVQGFWCFASQKPSSLKAYSDKLIRYFRDTCWVWRKGGPILKRYEKELDLTPSSKKRGG